jgi:hypothetical protein
MSIPFSYRRMNTVPELDGPIPPTAPLYIVPIAGTEGWGDPWWQDGSPWLQALENANCRAWRLDGRPFRWSTDLDGANVVACAWNALRGLLRRTRHPVLHRDWRAGGDACGYYLRDVPYEARNLVAHSHGGQVALYTAADGTPIRTLVTVGTPVRGDMEDVYAAARPHIGWHLHVCDAVFDLWGTLGQLFDGDVRIERTWPKVVAGGPGPDLTLTLEHIGHTKLLHDPREVHRWVNHGLLDLMRLGRKAEAYKAAFGVTI